VPEQHARYSRRWAKRLPGCISALGLIIVSGCGTDPNAARAMQDNADQRKRVQQEQDFAKTLPPTQSAPIYRQ
jgi:hypothetical protein